MMCATLSGMDAIEWEQRVADAWASLDRMGVAEFRATIDELAAVAPAGKGIGAFERASAFDSTGSPDEAVVLYRQALAAGLTGERRRRAVIQLASSLRNLGSAEESVDLLTRELDEPADHLDDAVRAFLALALCDVGREREAVSVLLGTLAPHLPRYQRSVAGYAHDLADDSPSSVATTSAPSVSSAPSLSR
jgi:thioredoxin-like negative regulator of GroEL